jgi:hypothetical protein
MRPPKSFPSAPPRPLLLSESDSLSSLEQKCIDAFSESPPPARHDPSTKRWRFSEMPSETWVICYTPTRGSVIGGLSRADLLWMRGRLSGVYDGRLPPMPDLDTKPDTYDPFVEDALRRNKERNNLSTPPILEGGYLFFPDDAVQMRNKMQADLGLTLTCEEPSHQRVTWCIHMERAIKDGYDSHLIWGIDIELDDTEWAVPIVPSHGQWASVRFAAAKKELGAVKAYLRRATQSDNVSNNELAFLGFLHPSEGRQVLRTMIYDWLQLQQAVEKKIECKNPRHSFQAQMMWERNTDSDRVAVAEYWSVVNTGKCLTCASSNEEDFSDLVPDGGGKKWA